MIRSPVEFTRRDLLRTGVGAAAALSVPRTVVAQDSPVPPTSPTPLFEISLAEWSLHRTIGAKQLDPLDFAKKAREGFGLVAIEYVNRFFGDRAGDFAYLREMKKRADDQGVRSLLIMVDGEGALGAADAEPRRQAVENHFKWLAAAGFLGCHSIRVNAHGTGSPEEQQKSAADSLHRLATMGETYGVSVIVENHGGLSSDGGWLAATIRLADHPGCGTLPDFGNFRIGGGKEYDRYKGVAELMPFAKAVSAKSYGFDAAGNETTIDYRRMVKIVLDAGYRGHLGVEFEGEGISEDEGIAKTKALLERIRDERSAKR